MRRQIRGLDRASANIEDGISLIQVADGALEESHGILQRMNELAVQAANDTNTRIDRDAIQLEMDALGEELTRIAETTSYNNHVYPLAANWSAPVDISAAGVGSVQQSKINEVSLTLINDLGNDIEVGGTTYHAGETITVDHVLWYDVPNASYGEILASSYGGTSWSHNPWRVTDYTQPLSLSSYMTGSALKLGTMSAVGTDTEDYLYISDGAPIPGTVSDRWYFHEAGMIGVGSLTPTMKADCLKASAAGGGGSSGGGAAGAATGGGAGNQPLRIQCGSEMFQSIEIPMVDARASTLGVEYLDVMTHTYASASITKVQMAIDRVSSYRSMFGAYQNRLEHAQASVDIAVINTQDAESVIRDTDMAAEMLHYSTSSILSQAAQSMLAQTSQLGQGALKLLE